MKTDFESLVEACKLNKSELADLLGVHRVTVYQWKDAPPKYATAFLVERKKVLALSESLAILKASVKLLKADDFARS